MNIRKQITVGLGLAFLAFGLTATQASAQEVYKGSFELPAAAYWGKTLLQPGQYSIRLDSVSPSISLIRLEGEGMHATLFGGAFVPERTKDRSSLTIVDANGAFYVSELNAGQIGKAFQFSPSKAAKERSLSASTAAPMTVPVTSASGF
jgi:hypothetical protein